MKCENDTKMKTFKGIWTKSNQREPNSKDTSNLFYPTWCGTLFLGRVNIAVGEPAHIRSCTQAR